MCQVIHVPTQSVAKPLFFVNTVGADPWPNIGVFVGVCFCEAQIGNINAQFAFLEVSGTVFKTHSVAFLEVRKNTCFRKHTICRP